DVRAVREPHRHDAFEIEVVRLRGRLDELCQLLGAAGQVLLIEHTLGDTTEEARRARLEHLAARAQQPCPRTERSPQRTERSLIRATGSSMANPGGSVASSNSTPPGSRK